MPLINSFGALKSLIGGGVPGILGHYSLTGTFRANAFDNSGNMYIVGGTTEGAVILKIDSTGNLVWQKKMFDNGSYFNDIAVNNSNSKIYCVGVAINSTTYYASYVTLNFDGTSPYARGIAGDTNVIGESICVDEATSSSYYTFNQIPATPPFTPREALYAKRNSSNTVLWSKDTSSTAFPRRIYRDAGRTVVFGGDDIQSGSTGTLLVPVTDSTGVPIERYRLSINGSLIGSGTSSYLGDGVMDSSGNTYWLTGGTIKALVKLDSNNNILWSKSLSPGYASSKSNIYVKMGVDSNGLIYIMDYNGKIDCYNSDGTIRFSRQLTTSPGVDYGFKSTSATNLFISANTTSNGIFVLGFPKTGSIPSNGHYFNNNESLSYTVSNSTVTDATGVLTSLGSIDKSQTRSYATLTTNISDATGTWTQISI